MISSVVPPTDDALFVLESCHSTWIFDTEKMRFRRVLKGLALDAHAATTAWRAYYGSIPKARDFSARGATWSTARSAEGIRPPSSRSTS
jgi:hypothetical protein